MVIDSEGRYMHCDQTSTSGCYREYQKRMNIVLDYIDSHYHEKLTVEDLANVAHFSAYHFHRIFHSIVGETVSVYVRNLRLSKSAHKLLYCNQLPVVDIALMCGFASQSDFSRSFKAFYGISPTQYRRTRERRAGSVQDSAGGVALKTGHGRTDPGMELKSTIRIASLPDLNVAYIRCTGLSKELKSSRIENAFSTLFRWGAPRGYIGSRTAILGVILDSPEIVPMEQCRYDVCMTVQEDVVPEGEIGVRRILTEGKYVVFTFLRSRPDADNIFFTAADFIYGCWMPDNGYLPDDKPFLEFFRQDAGTQGVWTDFYIPVKPF